VLPKSTKIISIKKVDSKYGLKLLRGL